MARYMVLAVLLGGMMLPDSSWAQKSAFPPENVARFTIPGKKIPDHVLFRRFGKDYMKATIKNNVVAVEGTSEIVVMIGLTAAAERLLKSLEPGSLHQLDNTRDTLDVDGDKILNDVDACPCVAGVENPDPSMNGCPAGTLPEDYPPCGGDVLFFTVLPTATSPASEKK